MCPLVLIPTYDPTCDHVRFCEFGLIFLQNFKCKKMVLNYFFLNDNTQKLSARCFLPIPHIKSIILLTRVKIKLGCHHIRECVRLLIIPDKSLNMAVSNSKIQREKWNSVTWDCVENRSWLSGKRTEKKGR